MQKVPYLIVIGDKEMASGAVAVRARGGQDLGVMSVDELSKKLSTDVFRKSSV
jgi:threonyl-tRNA synthetase